MNRKHMLQKVLGLNIFLALMLGCEFLTSAPTSTPSTEEPATASPVEEPTLIPPTNTPTRIPSTSTPEPANQYKDEYVTIVFGKTERMQELPEDFKLSPAEAGKEYLVLYLTVREIRGVHITNMLGSKVNRPTIEVDSGEEYSSVTGQVKGVKFHDLTNLGSSYELVEGSECIFVFEVPKGVRPSLLRMSYTYKLNIEKDESQSVDIETTLFEDEQGNLTVTTSEAYPGSTPLGSGFDTSTPESNLMAYTPTGEDVLQDAFDDNKNQWRSYYSGGRVAFVNDGHLRVVSYEKGYVNVGTCNGCGVFSNDFYFEADVVLNQFGRVSYGLAFCITENNNYYIYSINHNNFKYTLIKLIDDKWFTLIDETLSEEIKAHPNSNKLAVSFEEGTINLFINGVMVDTYYDPQPLANGEIGLIIDGAGAELYGDNVFAYER